MFDEILQMVKEHMGSNPAVAGSIPAEQADAVHTEIANHISNGLQNANATQSAGASILTQIEQSLSSGGLATSAITGGLVSSLASKFGLPPSVTGAIAGSLPGLLQKFTARNAAGPAQTAS